MKKLCKRLLGVLTVLCIVIGMFGMAQAQSVQAGESEPEPILSSSEAEMNCEGELLGWGKITHPYLGLVTMKVLPEWYAGTVKVQGSWLRSVVVTKDTELSLYGLYEDGRGDIYRHVGVIYQNREYYGYIPENYIGAHEWLEKESDIVPDVTITQPPTDVPEPTEAPVQNEVPAPTLPPDVSVVPEPVPTVTPTPEPVYEVVSEGYYDENVIPDKYNTGCCDSSVLEKINSACVVDGVEYKLGDNGKRVVIDLYYSNTNKGLADEVVIRNKDFSDKVFSVYRSNMRESQMKIVFENCVFDQIFLDYTQDMVDFCFVDCTIRYFSGSEATFDKCFFGGSCYDGMNPFRNVTVRDSYFAGYPQSNDMGKHSDATHIFGKTDIDAENIVFRNCRMEMPMIKDRKGSTGYINACLMVALEYSNARDFLFEDCILNGGGYTLYALDSDGKCELENIMFRNISFGSGNLYGDIYPKVAEGVIFENLYDTENLYVASVWKDYMGQIHLSVSNDTAEDKTLLIVTENGKQEIMIPSKATSEAAGAMEYYDLAIDMEIVPEDVLSNWVVCYDGEETAENQIRYVNWSGEDVYRIVE